ncbi:MAG: hypothetical protein D6788_07875, partial [Planctomycetota bacterium]
MGRETKVGLLAGMAFIVCFAMILANRGRPPRTAVHRVYRVDRGDTKASPASRPAEVRSAPVSPASASPGPRARGARRAVRRLPDDRPVHSAAGGRVTAVAPPGSGRSLPLPEAMPNPAAVSVSSAE